MTSHAIRMENVHYAYPSAIQGAPPVPVLQGIDLAVEIGAFLAVMGPTGAGKTTLCLALNGLVPQATGGTFRGDVWVAGQRCGCATARPAPAAADARLRKSLRFGFVG